MRTDIMSFVLTSENRKSIVRTIFEYPKRQWSCFALEDLTKISHPTVFRTLIGLRDFGILKSFKINKKDILYELIESPLSKELIRAINVEKITSKTIAINFLNKIKSNNVLSIILYGSSVKGTSKPGSDIDILIILDKHDKILEEKILNIAAETSSEVNRTISAFIMNKTEIDKEKDSKFIKSVKDKMEVLYGKKPF